VLVGLERLHNEELTTLQASRNTIRGIKERNMRWVEHVEHMVDERNA